MYKVVMYFLACLLGVAFCIMLGIAAGLIAPTQASERAESVGCSTHYKNGTQKRCNPNWYPRPQIPCQHGRCRKRDTSATSLKQLAGCVECSQQHGCKPCTKGWKPTSPTGPYRPKGDKGGTA